MVVSIYLFCDCLCVAVNSVTVGMSLEEVASSFDLCPPEIPV